MKEILQNHSISRWMNFIKREKDITILISDLITHFRNIMVIGATNSEDLVYTIVEEYKDQAKKAGAE